ncbi:MAG: hypothetical protein SGPRY_011933 [Prymnesium sp.]
MGLRFLPNGCSWYETHRLGGCVRRSSPRSECRPHPPSSPHRLAVIIPFRAPPHNRQRGLTALKELCRRLPLHLKQQQPELKFHLFVVNQTDDLPFNRGALVNAAVRAIAGGKLRGGFDYYAIHDIDRFPRQNGSSECAAASSSYYTYPQNNPRALNPNSFAGGVLVLSKQLFQAVNGFSNEYWGWAWRDARGLHGALGLFGM